MVIQVFWTMAAFRSFITLTLCVLLGRQTFAKNDSPCERSKWNNGFNTFLKRHIRSGLPTTLDDKSEWMSYIRNNGGCDRPTQSFLHPKELDRVKAVCTSAGGSTYKENLCISRQPFTFVTVRSEPGTCGIRNVRSNHSTDTEVNRRRKIFFPHALALLPQWLPPRLKATDNDFQERPIGKGRGQVHI
uniref:Si:dkey-237j11.3 n=1 Tax=Cynoglossus semilaevis TaxID=244447 RepID=A0A3P8UN28_CYNSE